MITRDDPVKSVTCYVSRLGNVLSHVVMQKGAADLFSDTRSRIIEVNVKVAEDKKISW